MIVLECKCGKKLKVADTMAGKKVKCPECAAVLAVPAEADDDVVEAKASPTKQVVTSAKKQSSPAIDVDADEDRPRKKPGKKAAKSGSGMLLWLLLGGAAVAFFGLIAVGGGVWFFFFRGKPLTGPGSVSEPVAIKLWVPYQKNARRQLKGSFNSETTTAMEGQGAPKGPKGDGNFKESGTFDVIIQTLEVNDQGEETKIEMTVQEFTTKMDGAGIPNEVSLPRGTVYLGEKRKTRWTWTSRNGGVPGGIPEQFRRIVGGPAIPDEAVVEKIFGTDKKVTVGETWPVNKAEFVKHAETTGPNNADLEVDGTCKFAGVANEGGKAFLDVHYDITIKQSKKKNELSGSGHAEIRLPADGATGKVREVSKFTFTIVIGNEGGQQPGKLTGSENVTLDITYLPPGDGPGSGGKDTSKDTGIPIDTKPSPKDTPKETKPPEPPRVTLTNPNGIWAISGTGDNMTINAFVQNTGGPFRPTARYELYAWFQDANKTKQRYMVASKSGALLKNNDLLSGKIKVTSLANPDAVTGDLVLYEIAAGSDDYVAVGQTPFTPSGTVPLNLKKATAANKVELSAVKVDRNGKIFTFEANYRFSEGKPNPTATYRWEVELLDKNNKKLVVDLALFTGAELQQQGKLNMAKEVPQELREPGPRYVMNFTETIATTPTINIAFPTSGAITGKGVDTTPPTPKVQVQVVGSVQRQGKGLVITAAYKFVQGQPDPNSQYKLMIELKGKGKSSGFQQLLGGPGGQFKAEDKYFNNQIPNSGETSWDIVLVEINAANPKGKILDTAKGTIQGK